MNEVGSISPGVAVAGRNAMGRFAERLLASAVHLAACVLTAGCVVAVVFLGWYAAPLDTICDVGEILFLVIAVDVVLGPIMTLVVFDRRKKSLRFDLACIATLQIAALSYGVFVVEAGRPHYLVFVKDRFEVVSRIDLQETDRAAAAANRIAATNWFGPRIVAAEGPTSETARKDLLLESVLGGRDLQHFPKQYRDYATQAGVAASRGQPIAALRSLNPGKEQILSAAVQDSGLPEERLRFLPIKGPKGDATMLIEASTGTVVAMLALLPWR